MHGYDRELRVVMQRHAVTTNEFARPEKALIEQQLFMQHVKTSLGM